MPRCACSAGPTAATSSSWPARGATAPTGGWPRPSLSGRGARVRVLEAADVPGGALLPRCDLVVDGAYGTGFRGTYDAPQVPAGAAVLAIDIPSGVDTDTGEAAAAAVRADRTVTFAALKPGLLQGEGPRLSGVVEVADIGIGVPTPRALLMEDVDVAALLPPRPRRREQMDERRRCGRRLGRHGGVRHPVHPGGHGRRRRHDPPGLARRPVRALAHRGRAHAPAGAGVGRRLPGGDGQVQGDRDRPRARHRRRRGRGDPGRAGRGARCRWSSTPTR